MHPHDDREDNDHDDEEQRAGSEGQDQGDSFFLIDELGGITSAADQSRGGPPLWFGDHGRAGHDRSEAWFSEIPERSAGRTWPERWQPVSQYRDGDTIDAAYLAIVRCRGVMVGDHNKLISTYLYRIDQPTVNLAKMLAHPAVQEALAAVIAADPNSFQAARRHAQGVLSAGTWFPVKHALIDLQETAPEASDELGPILSTLDGAIIIEDCRGLQIGSHNSQYSEFSYVCRDAPIDAVQLLSGNSKLAYALIDHVVGDGSANVIDEALSESLQRSAEVRRLAQPNPVNWNGYHCGRIVGRRRERIEGHDGVVAGLHNTVTSKVSVVSAVNETREAMLRNLATLRRTGESAAAKAEREARERKQRIEEILEEIHRKEAAEAARQEVEIQRQRAERLEASKRDGRTDRTSRGGGFDRF